MDLVDHDHVAFVVEAHLVFGVDQNQALLLGEALALGEESARDRAGFVVERLRDGAAFD